MTALWNVYCGAVVAILVPREDVQLSVPLTGNLSNTSTHYDPGTWTLYNPVFNQTTWESQPYVPYFGSRLNVGVEWVYWTSNSGGGNGILAGFR